jgi:hypothetical protein
MAREIIFLNDRIERALDLLVEQDRDKAKLRAYLTAYLSEFQVLEDVFKDLYLKRSLDSAEGAQLDGLGQILVLEREGRTDDEYRAALKFQAFLNQSKGEPETLIAALKVFTGATRVAVWELFPAKCYGWYDSDIPEIPPDLDAQMDSLCAGGVKWAGSIIGNKQPFVFDKGYPKPPDNRPIYGGFAIVDASNNLINDGFSGKFSIAIG